MECRYHWTCAGAGICGLAHDFSEAAVWLALPVLLLMYAGAVLGVRDGVSAPVRLAHQLEQCRNAGKRDRRRRRNLWAGAGLSAAAVWLPLPVLLLLCERAVLGVRGGGAAPVRLARKLEWCGNAVNSGRLPTQDLWPAQECRRQRCGWCCGCCFCCEQRTCWVREMIIQHRLFNNGGDK